MLREVGTAGKVSINADALRSEIRQALINQKANACPIAARLAWHAAGTYDRRDGTGGCNGGLMRFLPEMSDKDNAGLSIVRDLLHPVKRAHPELSHADLYAFAGCVAIEFLGGPRVPFAFGRTADDVRFFFFSPPPPRASLHRVVVEVSDTCANSILWLAALLSSIIRGF
jgi:catalase (peroxidase I)